LSILELSFPKAGINVLEV